MSIGSSFAALPPLTIPSGGSESNALPAPTYVNCVALLLYGPAAVDGATTYRLQVHPNPAATNASSGWCDLQDAGNTNIECPGVNDARLYSELVMAGAIRVKASGNVGANRTWNVTGVRTL